MANQDELTTLRTQLTEAQATLEAEHRAREAAERELQRIDCILDRRDALVDQPTREAKILKLLHVAKGTDPKDLSGKLEAAEAHAADLQRQLDEANKWKEPILAHNQPCGCVVCYCEGDQCTGCGAGSCDRHRTDPSAVAKEPNAVWVRHPVVESLAAAKAENERLNKIINVLGYVSMEEAQKAYDAAEPADISEAQLNSIVADVRFNSELEAENKRLREAILSPLPYAIGDVSGNAWIHVAASSLQSNPTASAIEMQIAEQMHLYANSLTAALAATQPEQCKSARDAFADFGSVSSSDGMSFAQRAAIRGAQPEQPAAEQDAREQAIDAIIAECERLVNLDPVLCETLDGLLRKVEEGR